MNKLSPKKILAVSSRSGSRRKFPFADWSSNHFQISGFKHSPWPIRQAEIPAQLKSLELPLLYTNWAIIFFLKQNFTQET